MSPDERGGSAVRFPLPEDPCDAEACALSDGETTDAARSGVGYLMVRMRWLIVLALAIPAMGAAVTAPSSDARLHIAPPRAPAYAVRSADRTVLAWQDVRGVLWVVRDSRRATKLLSEGPDVYAEGITFWDWAPSSHLLVSDVGRRVLVVDAQTGHRVDVTPNGSITSLHEEPRWSPAGDLIAYVRLTPTRRGCKRVDVGVAPATGGGFRTLVTLFRPTAQDEQGAENPLGCGEGKLEQALGNSGWTHWSSDGRMLLVPRGDTASGKPLRAVDAQSTGRSAGAKAIAELRRRLR
jgi:hypothetical protein